MLTYPAGVLTPFADSYGSACIVHTDQLCLVKVCDGCDAGLVGGRYDGARVQLPMPIGLPGCHMLVAIDYLPCASAIHRYMDEHKLQANLVSASARLKVKDVLLCRPIPDHLGARLCYGSNLAHVVRQHRIILSDMWESFKDLYAEALYKSAMEKERRITRQRTGLRRMPCYDEHCPEDYTAWFIRSGAESVDGVWPAIAKFVSHGRNSLCPPHVRVSSLNPKVPDTVWALPVECVHPSYLCQDC